MIENREHKKSFKMFLLLVKQLSGNLKIQLKAERKLIGRYLLQQ